MHRILSVTSASLLALATIAQDRAQAQGTIYFSVNGQSSLYSVDGNGNYFTTYSTPTGVPSGRSDYPTGRLFLTRPGIGTIPGTGITYTDVLAHDITGSTVQVTNFRGPLWVVALSLVQWSNDSQDTFISFCVYDANTGLYNQYRAWVSGQDIASPGFAPLTPQDGRLERVRIPA